MLGQVMSQPEALLAALPSPLASIVQGALEAEGIPARIEHDVFGGVYGLDTGLFATRLYVPADRVEEARALIAEIEADDQELGGG